ncbi:aminopeptidase P N-terminal domain-containing protein [Synechococcus sp. M16CYN]|uniref:aminopeptidase P N-terminal domain-containing protein n=1 Tax=Synechococcus sp. M16CYN TaxID=3103139 RepID=UPI00333E9420
MTVFNLDIYALRRERFLEQLGVAAAIIPASELTMHHADCEWPFRQDSDFFYLTGFDEPGAVALLLPHRPKGERFVLFVQPKDPAAEVWTGFRWGTEGAVKHYGADIAHPLDQLTEKRLTSYLQGAEAIAFRIGRHPKIEPLVLSVWGRQLDTYSHTGIAALGLVAPTPILHSLRLRKEPHELERLREACLISAEAHELARQITKPGMKESEVQAVIEAHFRASGTRGPAYTSIVAGGDNACVLHYTANTALLQDGDLLLIDAGCSVADYYNGDITRTFPINGRFSAEQKELYSLVLAAQEAAIQAVRPGETAEKVHATALRVLVEGLVDLGLLEGDPDGIIERGDYRHLYMHRTGHWLGLDVHDVGAYRLGERPVELETGVVLTVEPGLYVSDRLAVPEGQPEIEECWKGIGIRIEDDVAVTEHGHEVLSQAAEKSIVAMER